MVRGGWIVVTAVLGACSFDAADNGNSIDADPNQPDADSTVVDADTTRPDGRHPDAQSIDAHVFADANPTATCPSGYVGILSQTSSTSMYRFEPSPNNWLAAEIDCENDALPGDRPSHLAVVDDTIERTALIGGAAGGANLNDQWLGLTDLANEDEWQFVTNQAGVLIGNPGSNADNKDCARLKNDGSYEARACDDTERFVCECDGATAVPERFPDYPDGNN